MAAKGPSEAQPFLRALVREGIVPGPEVDIHVAHDGFLAGARELEQHGCRIHACAPDTSILKLWGRAIAQSQGEYVAVLDLCSPPADSWWPSVLQEVRAGTAVFAGSVLPGWPANDWRVAGYLVDYVQFHPPQHHTVHEVPGINFVCARSLLDGPADLRDRGFFKTFTVWRLARERGLRPVRRDDMPVTYRRPLTGTSFLRRRFLHGRCFAGMRHAQPGQPARWLCIAFFPLLPWLKCWRVARAARRQATSWSAFMRQWHWVVAAETAWSVGELVGYLLGSGRACERLD